MSSIDIDQAQALFDAAGEVVADALDGHGHIDCYDLGCCEVSAQKIRKLRQAIEDITGVSFCRDEAEAA